MLPSLVAVSARSIATRQSSALVIEADVTHGLLHFVRKDGGRSQGRGTFAKTADARTDGHNKHIVQAQSRKVILTDKIVEIALRTNRIKHRDLWYIDWPKQQKVALPLELVGRKRAHHKCSNEVSEEFLRRHHSEWYLKLINQPTFGEIQMANDTKWNIPPNKGKALMLAKRQLSELVYDAVNLEGINFTLPEIQTLLDGITVGGHKITDQEIALNQANTWRTLFKWVEQDDFTVSAQSACELHAIAAKNEALEWGKFRTGSVTIAGTGYMPPKAANLPHLFESLVVEMAQLSDIYDQAIFVFLSMARNQFFYDVNKRMGRFMMNGLLLSAGYPAINLPAKRQLEFNSLMIEFYTTGQQQPMNTFLRSCMDERIVAIMQEE